MAGSAIVERFNALAMNTCSLLRAGVRSVTVLPSPMGLPNTPTVVVLAAAKVGGIQVNSTFPADFLLENLKIQTNVIETAWRTGVRRLLGSSRIYPLAEQPIREKPTTGALEPTNESYSIAKISGLKLCEALRKQYKFDATNLMPTNLYGRR